MLRKQQLRVLLLVLTIALAAGAGPAGCNLINGLDDFERVRGTGGAETTTTSTSVGGSGSGGGSGGAGGCEPCTDDNLDDCIGCLPGACGPSPLPAGSACGIAGQVCNASGQCVDCLTDLDGCVTETCVGVLCTGAACRNESACESGFCADGVCCDIFCDGECEACNLPGAVGVCLPVPTGMVDDDTCNADIDCGAPGSDVCACFATTMVDSDCQSTSDLLVGEPCDINSDCFSGECSMGYCRLTLHAPCDDDVACDSNLCDDVTNRCKVCDADCPSGPCNGAYCPAVPGAPCGGPINCADGVCTSGLCETATGGACDPALPAGCVSNVCEGGTCVECTTTNCSTMCLGGGICALPAGAYCRDSTECASGVCSGFPLRCQP